MNEKNFGGASFQPLSADELQMVEGGLSLSDVWDSVKSAVNQVVDAVVHIWTCPCNHFPRRF